MRWTLDFGRPNKVEPPGLEAPYQEYDETGRLVRAIIDFENEPAVIVTAYRTSNVAKYWRPPP
jgi:hypothetical protein